MPQDASQSPTFPDPVTAVVLGSFINLELDQPLTNSNARQFVSLHSELKVTLNVHNI